MNKKNTITIIVLIGVVLIVAGIFIAFGNHGNTPLQQPTQSGTSASGAARPYGSPDDGFLVNFPQTPDVSKTTFSSPTAGPIPVTKYEAQSAMSGSDTKDYVIDVYHYPQNYKFPSGYLSGALKLFVAVVNAKYPGVKLMSQNSAELSGSPAISGVISVPIGGKPTTGYISLQQKGKIPMASERMAGIKAITIHS